MFANIFIKECLRIGQCGDDVRIDWTDQAFSVMKSGVIDPSNRAVASKLEVDDVGGN